MIVTRETMLLRAMVVTRKLSVLAVVMSAFLIGACGTSESASSGSGSDSGPKTHEIDPLGITCTESNGLTTCPIKAGDVNTTGSDGDKVTDTIDLMTFIQELGVDSSAVVALQAHGGSGGGADSNTRGPGGVAQTVTTISDFQQRFGTTTIYFYIGLAGNNHNHAGNGGASTIIATVDGNSSSEQLDTDSNVVLVAGGSGSGGGGTWNHSSQGNGGAGGVAVTRSPNGANCSNGKAICGAGSDGTSGDQHGETADGGKGGNQGTGGAAGDKAKPGHDGVGGRGAERATGSSSPVGWAGGYKPSYTQSNNLGQGGKGHESSEYCSGARESTIRGVGGGGGGGYGGGGGAQSHKACPSDDKNIVTVGGGGGGGGSFATLSTQTAPSNLLNPQPDTGNGSFELVFVTSSGSN
ncbi:MAG: hypothetical protein ACFB50_03150 [Rubrobacteraceae bacterium]